jgi:hypothetical protein
MSMFRIVETESGAGQMFTLQVKGFDGLYHSFKKWGQDPLDMEVDDDSPYSFDDARHMFKYSLEHGLAHAAEEKV